MYTTSVRGEAALHYEFTLVEGMIVSVEGRLMQQLALLESSMHICKTGNHTVCGNSISYVLHAHRDLFRALPQLRLCWSP